MFIDTRGLPDGHVIAADVCIIGAGAAGITLARELIGQPFRVCLLESGGLEPDADTQALYQGENVGHPYFPLESCRLRYFGGSTNHWGGFCRPLDSAVFEPRPWVADSGWPFPRSHLEPYYLRAHPICGLGPFAYTHEDWKPWARRCLAFASDRLISAFFQLSNGGDGAEQAQPVEPVRFGQRYRAELERAANLDTYLHANVLGLETDAAAGTVTRARIGSLAGHRAWVAARLFVLATGGIENARLLLLSNGVQKAGLGNPYDLVGRYFAEHPMDYSGEIMLTALTFSQTAYPRHRARGVWVNAFLTPSPETERRERLLNCGISIGGEPVLQGTRSLRAISHSLLNRHLPEDFSSHLRNVVAEIDSIASRYATRFFGRASEAHEQISGTRYWAEPVPNPDSRVTLGTERDPLGQPRVRLDWRLRDQDLDSMKRVHRLLGEELGRAGLGRLRLLFDDDAAWLAAVHGCNHHMGTTRMHSDPKKGVVDPDCRVHGVSNLFVAGSSVFPVCGHANPTLTIVALALRLADHIKARMA